MQYDNESMVDMHQTYLLQNDLLISMDTVYVFVASFVMENVNFSFSYYCYHVIITCSCQHDLKEPDRALGWYNIGTIIYRYYAVVNQLPGV